MKLTRTMELILVTKKEKGHISESQINFTCNNNVNTILQPKDASVLTKQKTTREKILKRCNPCLLSSSWNLQFLTLCFLLFIILLSNSIEVNGSPYIMKNCLLNPELAVDPEEAEKCKYGFKVDGCGTHFCLKGPRDYCGGKFERYGVCGEGLMCNKCNRCTGCSTKSFQCWYDENCIWSSD